MLVNFNGKWNFNESYGRIILREIIKDGIIKVLIFIFKFKQFFVKFEIQLLFVKIREFFLVQVEVL